MNGNRRPETLNRHTYHAVNYNEAAHVFEEALGLYDCSMRMMEWMPEECRDAFYELVHFPVCASANVIRMQILAGWNEMYAAEGEADLANACARLTAACIRKDKELTENYHTRNHGKWNGMASSAHVGFVNWNDEGWSYPECVMYNESTGTFEIVSVAEAEEDAAELPSIDEMDVTIVIPAMEAEGTAPEHLEELRAQYGSCGAYVEQDGYVAMEANHFAEERKARGAEWFRLTDYGKTDSGMKMYPVTKSFKGQTGPVLVYEFVAAEEKNYTLELYMAPTNALVAGGTQKVGVKINDSKRFCRVNGLPENFAAGNCYNREWSQGVLDNIHRATLNVALKKGMNRLEIYGMDAGVVLERIVLWSDYKNRKRSYFGPLESYRL